MNEPSEPGFLVTGEYRRFAEFCDACGSYRYIGLCYGPPGVGKTVSARHYANWDKVEAYEPHSRRSTVPLGEVVGSQTIIYTPAVVNAPKGIEDAIRRWRKHLHQIALRPLYEEETVRRDEVERIVQERMDRFMVEFDWLTSKPAQDPRDVEPNIAQVTEEFAERRSATPDPTRLVIVDEADRLKMPGLEQVRDIYDRGEVGLVLIGMPGIEKRLARYPQLYSRIGFVHAFRPLTDAAVRSLLRDDWRQLGAALPVDGWLDDNVVSAIARITGGNFRLLNRLLAQVERIARINGLQVVTKEAVEAARETLVIGAI